MTKTCKKCGQEKPVSEFSPNSDGKNTYPRSACKVCEATSKREIRQQNGDHVREVSRRRFAGSTQAREDRNTRARAWRERKRKELGGSLYTLYQKYNYGLTAESHARLCEAYPVCGICGRDTHMKTDHCHETGKVRGRLCTGCNTAIGRLGDNIPGLMRAIEYLANPRF